ncbi:hypothetical protein P8452_64995 [Trifolium repens]|nr:hypothetical protein P8452_33026 [Trifolium repens]WJX82209.1 hypothetical protein P8452_64995 [Trifolium repens]
MYPSPFLILADSLRRFSSPMIPFGVCLPRRLLIAVHHEYKSKGYLNRVMIYLWYHCILTANRYIVTAYLEKQTPSPSNEGKETTLTTNEGQILKEMKTGTRSITKWLCIKVVLMESIMHLRIKVLR